MPEPLDSIHHVAVSVRDVAASVRWYAEKFRCRVTYQDETWALLQFENASLALVIADEHPPHLAFESPDAGQFGSLTPHRDGTRSIYIQDPSGNSVEVLQRDE